MVNPINKSAPHHPPLEPAEAAAVKPKIGKNILIVFLVILGLIIMGCLIIGVLVAKTGLVNVPVLSKLYKGPTPTRLVQTSKIEPAAFQYLLISRLTSQVQTGKPPYTFQLTEQELTGALQQGIAEAFRDQAWSVEIVQLVVTEQGLEFLGKFKQDKFKVEGLIRLRPTVQDGGILFTPVEIRLGDYPVPLALAERAAGLIFERDFGTWLLKFRDIIFQQVVSRDGFLQITASPATS